MESELNITDFKINSFPKKGIEEEAAKKEAARLRAEALLIKTQEMAGLVYSKDPAPPPVVVKAPVPVPPKPDSKSIKVPVLMSGDLGLDIEDV